jgi:prepilin peptidase CpaA
MAVLSHSTIEDTRMTRSSDATIHPKGAAIGSVGGRVFAFSIAVLVVGCLFWTGQEKPLPALPWAAAFLFLAVEQDVRQLRIPNWLTFPSLLLAIVLAAVTAGWAGAGAAAAGAGLAFALLFVPFACRWVGAGDVKAAMVLGALWGTELFLPICWWMVVMGGVLAIALVAIRGGLVDLASRWFRSLQLTVLTRRPTYCAPAATSAAGGGLPFAVAMGMGAVAYQIWGMPWF